MNDRMDPARREPLRQMVEALGTADSVEEVVQTIRISARALAGADGITFVRREGGFVHYIAEDAIGPLWTGQRFPIESCVSGIAMTSRAPIIISDIFADPRVPHHAYEPTFVKSMAMFPLGATEKLAAIGAYWSRAGQIDADTIETLAAISGAAGDALDRFGGEALLSMPAPPDGAPAIRPA